MTKVRRPILFLVNFFLLLLGIGAYFGGRSWSTLRTEEFTGQTEEQIVAEVDKISNVIKLRGMVVDSRGHLSNFAELVAGATNIAFVLAVLCTGFATLNLALIPWKLPGNRPPH